MQIDLSYLKQKKLVIGLVLLFCLSLIIIRWLNVPMAEKLYDPRSGTYGDVWSCLNVQSAATYFRDHGFGPSCGLPMFSYTGLGSEQNAYIYTHYPPLPDELAGVMATVTGSVDTRVLSIFPLCLSLVFFGLIFVSLQAYNPHRASALAASILTVISCYYICWADDIHQHVYGEFCKWLFVLLLFIYYNRKEKRGKILFVLCLLALVNTWITFEHILYYGIVTLGFSIIFERRLITKTTILLGLMPLIGLGLHVLQNYTYLGSWDLVVKDIKGAYTERTVGHDDSIKIGLKQIKEIPGELNLRFNRMFFIGTWPFIGIALVGFVKLWKEQRRLFWMGIVLFIASASWIFFMTQHVYIHLFTIRHFGLFYAFMLSWGIYALTDFCRRLQRKGNHLGLIVGCLLIAICLIPTVESHFYYAYLKFGYLYPKLGIEAHFFDLYSIWG